MSQPVVAYWPVACDLARSPKGARIVVGPETAIACDGVIQHMKGYWKESHFKDYVILPAAGVSPDSKWGGRAMSLVMRDYFLDAGVPHNKLEPLTGKTFNTEGEARAVAEYLYKNPHIKRIVISVKWWHALRCYVWLDLCLWKLRMQNVEIEVFPLQTKVGINDILFEFWKAIPFNLIRMLKVRYFK